MCLESGLKGYRTFSDLIERGAVGVDEIDGWGSKVGSSVAFVCFHDREPPKSKPKEMRKGEGRTTALLLPASIVRPHGCRSVLENLDGE